MLKRKSTVLLTAVIVFFAGCAPEARELRAKEGDILWQHVVGENIESTTTIDESGNIYTTGGGYIWSFTSDGRLRWKTCPLDEGCKGLQQEYPYALGVASSPAVSPDGEKVYITGYAGVFAFRTSDGKLLWKRTVFDNYYEFAESQFEEQVKIWEESASKEYPKIFATTPAISADGIRLYTGCGDNDFSCDSFYCIDAKDGSVIWEYVMVHPPQQIEEGKYTRGYLGGASFGPDGTVYVASMHGWLVSLTDNGDSYTENWAYNVGAEMRMPPSMDAAGFLYVGSSSAGGYIHKVDSRTGKKAEGKWPVKTFASEVFANIAIATDGTIYANSEDYRLWAFNPDGTVKWNNLEFEHWGGDPIIRADDRIIVTSQLNKAARVVCVRDDGDKGVIEWFSEPITTELAFNETNVNIGPNGDIYVTSGVESPHALFGIKGNALGLSKTSPWPKYMGNIQNNGYANRIQKTKKLGKVFQERYRPQFHYTMTKGWINDPIGLVYYKGEYHLFNDHNPFSRRFPDGLAEGEQSHWSHAISPDLVHWKHMPIAVYPDENGACWSGSGVVDWRNITGFQTGNEPPLILFYTSAGKSFSQSLVFSNDCGRTWKKYEGNPVLKQIDKGNRDPSVFWHEPTKKWVMVLYVRQGSANFFTSDDLKEWTPTSEVQLEDFHECPDLFELPVDGDNTNTKWVLYDAGFRYWIGGFDGKTFTPQAGPLTGDYGNNFYAAQTWHDAQGRRIQIGWMREDDDLFCNMPFNQQMSFPCELTLRKTGKGIKLFRRPVPEIEKLYTQQFELTDTTIKPGDNPLSGIFGDLFDIEMEIEPGDTAQFGIRLHETAITYAGGKVTCLGSTADASLIDGSVKLRILVDRASLEVFINDGEVSMTSMFRPKEKNTGLELYTRDGNVNIRSLRVSKLKSSWIADQLPFDLSAIKGNGQGLSKNSPWPKSMGNIQNNGHAANKAYNEFYKRVLADEVYIGFFAAEKKCVNKVDEAYIKARRRFFLGVSVSDEEVEGYMRRFIRFCEDEGYLNDGCKEEWEKTLTILSYVLYANKPIFEFSADNIIEHRNLVFAEYPNKKLELDLFLPKQPMAEPVPCVVCIHGGGWMVNRRIWFEPFAKYLASKGMAAVTIDYRMLPAVQIIDCIYDSKAAVRWVRANAGKYGIDPDRIGAIGASAGAHIIALLATTANVPELEGSGGNAGVSSAIQAAVGFATPAFKIEEGGSRRSKRFGFTEEEMKRISPYENISANSAPLYLVHGTKDRTVKPQESQDLYDRYKEVGAHVELKWVPDEGHGFYEGTDLGIALAAEFFKKQFSRRKSGDQK